MPLYRKLLELPARNFDLVVIGADPMATRHYLEKYGVIPDALLGGDFGLFATAAVPVMH